MNWILRSIFYRMPKAGEIYRVDEEDDPFGDKYKKRRVLEVKDGWVRYEWVGSSMWKDERKSRACFHGCYIRDC